MVATRERDWADGEDFMENDERRAIELSEDKATETSFRLET
jgi:hypothetical protein